MLSKRLSHGDSSRKRIIPCRAMYRTFTCIFCIKLRNEAGREGLGLKKIMAESVPESKEGGECAFCESARMTICDSG